MSLVWVGRYLPWRVGVDRRSQGARVCVHAWECAYTHTHMCVCDYTYVHVYTCVSLRLCVATTSYIDFDLIRQEAYSAL